MAMSNISVKLVFNYRSQQRRRGKAPRSFSRNKAHGVLLLASAAFEPNRRSGFKKSRPLVGARAGRICYSM